MAAGKPWSEGNVFLSGIQPSGQAHLGNYFGAIRQHLVSQDEAGEHFYFIADLHALTTSRDPEALRENVVDVAVTYLALGLDPERAVLFRQSDVPEVTEIQWLLACVTGMGLLERAHSYKDKLAHGVKPSVGLFTYPILMAADILAYDASVVPVGKDQKQHVEMAQDMAQSFNARYGASVEGGEVFRRPEGRLPAAELFAKVPGVDGEKMSKTYGNTIWIFEEGKKLKKAVGRILTDSREPAEPKDPAGVLLLDFLALFLDEPELADWRERVRAGGPDAPGYGHLKVRLVEAMDAAFGPARERRLELLADRGELEAVLRRGAEVARERASCTLDRAYRAAGIR
ncbi:MAG TPA: tryptophan--tRNA ligase [Planctomycetes bacterium]|nr:tryptophan--tRNA ligase [Planctomycetota bacterium]